MDSRQSHYHELGQLDPSECQLTEYDIVIVGGGTSGLVLANRLSENPQCSVLVLEAGYSGVIHENSVVPAFWPKLFATERDWKYRTVPQKHADGQPAYWPRGKMLGGCTSINAMMFHHCAPEDYDEWSRLGGPGAEGWRYEEFKRYLLKLERFSPDPSLPVSLDDRGDSGLMQTGYFNYKTDMGDLWLQSAHTLGINKVPDINTRNGTLGSTRIQSYVDSNRRRVSTEVAYLPTSVLTRPNLKVITGARVVKLLFEVEGDKCRAIGVECTPEETRTATYNFRAKKEVILSGGAIGSPHILLLSGVGPAEQLEEHGISVVHDLPGVGAALYDHIILPMRFKCRTGMSLQYLAQSGFVERLRTAGAIAQWKFGPTGPLSSIRTESVAFFRSTDPALFPPTEYGSTPESLSEDSASGPGAPDLEIIFSPMKNGIAFIPEGDYISMGVVLVRPTSVGTLKLNSSDPFAQPAIDPNYLATARDLDALVRGFKIALKLMKTSPIAEYLDFDGSLDPRDPLLAGKYYDMDDATLGNYVRRLVKTVFHPTSTLRMCPLEDGGVVDPRLRVHGIPNLRIVDASIMPSIPAGHTSAPTIAIGEKASDMIKEDFYQRPN